MPLLSIDSRARDDYDTTQPNNIRIVIENSISFRKISLVFADLSIDPDSAGDNIESCYFMKFREFPKNVRGAAFQDSSSFILVKRSAVSYRSMSFENESFAQTIDLGEEKTFSEFNISLHYRSGAAVPLSLTNDWSAVFRVE